MNGNINISRAIGDFDYKRRNKKPEEHIIIACPDVKKIKTSTIDFILMGSDGIGEQKSSSEMNEFIKSGLKRTV